MIVVVSQRLFERAVDGLVAEADSGDRGAG
jgi:hypothetical protein